MLVPHTRGMPTLSKHFTLGFQQLKDLNGGANVQHIFHVTPRASCEIVELITYNLEHIIFYKINIQRKQLVS